MMSVLNSGAPLPDYGDQRWYMVLAPKGKTPCGATLLADTFQGFWTHWVKDGNNPRGKVIPCDGHEVCHSCKRGLGNRWTGYIPCLSWQHKAPKVLALTEFAARQLLPYITKRGTLRGLEVVLQREEDFPNARVKVTVKKAIDPAACPPEFDMMPSLNRMWGLGSNWKGRNGQAGKESPRIDRSPNDLTVFDRNDRHDEGERPW